MIVVRTVDELRQVVSGWKAAGETVALVPTMGYLHRGHLSLITEARRAGAARVIVSIFVNPKQFGPGEDLERYPRNEARDRRLLEENGVDLLFAPETGTVYPSSHGAEVRVSGVSEPLEGSRRPGHFDGVVTVVLKLFNMAQPDIAVFGRKDAQQCAVVQQMVEDLNVPVRLVFGETIREADGLAMSSRNSYLDREGRETALALIHALRRGAAAAEAGADRRSVERSMSEELEKYPGAKLDYLRAVDPRTFLPAAAASDEWLLAGAIRVGTTRLIDNLIVRRPSRKAREEGNLSAVG